MKKSFARSCGPDRHDGRRPDFGNPAEDRRGGVETSDEVRSAGRQLAGFSNELAEEERELKRFLYTRLYNSAELVPVRIEAQRVVAGLSPLIATIRLASGDWRSEEDESKGCGRSATSLPA